LTETALLLRAEFSQDLGDLGVIVLDGVLPKTRYAL